ncbi:LOW QUALITY PROTEIN: PPR domain-containing protein/PPR_1 domain-containing protein/PPR_2 domain-containing protein, partial [Cephalotus follicularis]
ILANKGIFRTLKTDNFLVSSLVKANELHNIFEVFDIICYVVSPDVFFFSIAINAFCKGGRTEDALGLFLKMENLRIAPNVVTYNIIHGLCKNGRLEEAFHFKEKMIEEGVKPSLIPYSDFINGLIKSEKFYEANHILKEMSNRVLPNEFVYNTLIDGYCKMVKNIEEGEELFNELITKKVELNSAIYNTLIRAYYKKISLVSAFKLRDDMKSKCILLTSATYYSLIHGMCNNCLVEDALLLYEMRKDGLLPDIVCYTALIGDYSKLDYMDKVRSVLQEMTSYNIYPNKITYSVMINGYCKLGHMKEASNLLQEVTDNGIVPAAVTYNALTNGFCKAGKIEEAFEV